MNLCILKYFSSLSTFTYLIPLFRVHSPIYKVRLSVRRVVMPLKHAVSPCMDVAVAARCRIPLETQLFSGCIFYTAEPPFHCIVAIAYHLYPFLPFIRVSDSAPQRLTVSKLASESAAKSPVPSNSSIATLRQTSMNHWFTIRSAVGAV